VFFLGEIEENQNLIMSHIVRIDQALITIAICLGIIGITQFVLLLSLIFWIRIETFVYAFWVVIALFTLILIVLAIGLIFSLRNFRTRGFPLRGKLSKQFIKRGEYYAETKDYANAKKYLEYGIKEAKRERDEKLVIRAEKTLKTIIEEKK